MLVLLAIAGSLRRRRGLLAAVGSALGTAVLVWLVLAAVVVWAPSRYADAAGSSTFAHVMPLPSGALREAGQLLGLPASPYNPPAGQETTR